MKAAICYYSRHHGNTRKVAEAMARAGEADLIDVTAPAAVNLEPYDLIGFASGIYGFTVHPSLVDFLRRNLPAGKRAFFACTYGLAKGSGVKDAVQAASEKGARVLGEFSCRGYNTFGPFKLVGGSGKGRPSAEDLQAAQAFYRSIAGAL